MGRGGAGAHAGVQQRDQERRRTLTVGRRLLVEDDERGSAVVDFTLSSLARRKGKNVALLLVYALASIRVGRLAEGAEPAVLLDEVHEEIPEDLDVVRFVAEGVAEHLADAGEFVLAVERQDHAEQAVELGALHALAEDEDVLREEPLVGGVLEVEVAAERVGGLVDEGVLLLDRLDVLEHRLALVRVDAEGGNHVEERVGVDVLLVGVAAEDELELGGGDELADDVLDVVADDAFGGGEVADAHADDPALEIGNGLRVAPLLDVLAHRDVLRLPMVRLHRLVEIVGPLELQGEDVEVGNLATVDDALRGEGGLRSDVGERHGLGAAHRRAVGVAGRVADAADRFADRAEAGLGGQDQGWYSARRSFQRQFIRFFLSPRFGRGFSR